MEEIRDFGGREGIRTLGLIVANDALSQLSYSPTSNVPRNFSRGEEGFQRKAEMLRNGSAWRGALE
jgi:hypothetical protein